MSVDSDRKSVTWILVPIYNEEKTMETTEALLAVSNL
jgi:hypothetical protein